MTGSSRTPNGSAWPGQVAFWLAVAFIAWLIADTPGVCG